MAPGSRDSIDLQTLSTRYASGEWSPAEVIALVLDRIGNYADPAVWITRLDRNAIEAQLNESLAKKQRGIPQPLLGVPFAVKDNIDVAGYPTTAACPDFAYTPEKSATVVTRLCDAGAILIGKTNFDQFATGLVGTRSPYGACKNTFDPRYISGGSSSGSAVAVAAGLVSFSLGTDTAGSGRVPAAFNNLVGMKPTRGHISTAGLFPACRSLDCISIFSLTCEDARSVADIAVAFDPTDPYSRPADSFLSRPLVMKGLRLGVPTKDALQFFGNADAERLYHAAIEKLRSMGATTVPVDFTPFTQTAALLYSGPWTAERYAAIKSLITIHPEAMLPVTRTVIERGGQYDAVSLFKAMHNLAALRRQTEFAWKQMDVLLLPTAGTIYTLDAVEAEPLALNTNLGYYTNFVNLLDLCALAVPNGFQSNGLPTGITFIAPAGSDRELLTLGQAWHHATGTTLGATSVPLPTLPPRKETAPMKTVSPAKTAKIAVVGAHLAGQPLNHQLTERGGALVQATRRRRFIGSTHCLGRCRLSRVCCAWRREAGANIELEVWELSQEAFGSFVAAIPAPLGVGTILLEDGQQVQGFICEPYALTGARDITSFGGWRSFVRFESK